MKLTLFVIILFSSLSYAQEDYKKYCTVKLSLEYDLGRDELIRHLQDKGYSIKKFRRRDAKDDRPFMEFETYHHKKSYSRSYISLSFRASVEYPVINWKHPYYRFAVLNGGDMISHIFSRAQDGPRKRAEIALDLIRESYPKIPKCTEELIHKYKEVERNGGFPRPN